MSADNRICVMEWCGFWYVWMGSLSAYYYEPPMNQDGRVFSSKEQALEYAEKEAENCTILEGGIEEIGQEEQRLGLQNLINDATIRLDNLKKHGKQYIE